jgi:hypothetical protein
MIKQFSIIVIMIFIAIDDRWGLAMTGNILMAAICNKAKCIAVRCFGYINYCHQQLVSASTLPSAWTIIINMSILDVAIFHIAINVLNRKRRCGGSAKYYRTSWVNMYVSHTIYPIQVDKPSIPTPHSSQSPNANVLKHFALGLAARDVFAGMTQEGCQWGMVLSSGNA